MFLHVNVMFLNSQIYFIKKMNKAIVFELKSFLAKLSIVSTLCTICCIEINVQRIQLLLCLR